MISLAARSRPPSPTVLQGVPWFTAAVFAVNAVAILRLPHASHDDRTSDVRKLEPPGPGPLRNLAWMASSFFIGVLWTNQVLLLRLRRGGRRRPRGNGRRRATPPARRGVPAPA